MDAAEALEMTIYLKMMKIISVEVNGTDTIEDIKTKVYRAEGVPVNQQRMLFASRLLTDAETITYHSIGANSTIDLYMGDGMDVFVKLPSQEKELILSVKTSDTVHTLKSKIQEKEGIPVKQQGLIYMGRLLEDNQILASIGIRDHAVLNLIIRPAEDLRISINMSIGRSIVLEVKSWYTIGDVKIAIESSEGLPSHQLKLSYDGNELDDALMLQDHEIADESALQLLLPPVKLLVKACNSSRELTLMVEQTDTISAVMATVEKKLHCKGKQYALTYAGKILQVDKTFAYYQMQGDATIHLHYPLN